MLTKRILIILITVFISARANSQVLPEEGRRLNYRIIGFAFPGQAGADEYELQVATGVIDLATTFEQHIVVRSKTKKNKVIAEVPDFGVAYTWRVICYGQGISKTDGIFHHFSTGACPAVDTSVQRLRIIKGGKFFHDGYVIPDYSRVMYDMNGAPIWYLPDTSCFSGLPGDLKSTGRGSFTFILGNGEAYEVGYDGNILWQAPNNGEVSGGQHEEYHHQLTRLKNGHYMVLGNEHAYVLKHWPKGAGKEKIIAESRAGEIEADTNYLKGNFGTLIEYDSTGQVVWSWHFLKYFKASDLYYFEEKEPSYWPHHNGGLDFDMHENGFYFDEKNKKAYLSYRRSSRILRIDYPGGKVDRVYGERYAKGIIARKNGAFYGQHACIVMDDGSLAVYNNNMRDSSCRPEVEFMQEPASDGGEPRVVWTYQCETDQFVSKPGVANFKTGGNVEELPGRMILISMSQPYCKISIVSHDKEVLWAALPERRDATDKPWAPMLIYRGSMIYDKAEIEKLVWHNWKGQKE